MAHLFWTCACWGLTWGTSCSSLGYAHHPCCHCSCQLVTLMVPISWAVSWSAFPVTTDENISVLCTSTSFLGTWKIPSQARVVYLNPDTWRLEQGCLLWEWSGPRQWSCRRNWRIWSPICFPETDLSSKHESIDQDIQLYDHLLEQGFLEWAPQVLITVTSAGGYSSLRWWYGMWTLCWWRWTCTLRRCTGNRSQLAANNRRFSLYR